MGARNEHIITLGDREVRVLFTNRALGEIEKETGKSVIGIAQGFTKNEAGVREIAIILRAGMEAARRSARDGGKPVTMDDAYEVMDEVGFSVVASEVMMAIAAVLSYDSKNDPNA